MSKPYLSALTDVPEAYLYVRFSTPEQAQGHSLQRQLDLGSKYASEHKLHLPDENIIIDSGLSAYTGANVDSGKFGTEFLKKLEQGLIKPGSILLVEAMDRISRQSSIDAQLLILGILKKKIKIVTLMDGKTLSEDNFGLEPMLNLNLKLAGGNDESLKKQVRLEQVWQKKRDEGELVKITSLCPSWLALEADKKSFRLIPERVAIVRRIYLEALNGAGSHSIVSRLNRDKIPTFGSSKGWAKSTVNRILTTRAVLGEFQSCTKKQKGRREPIGNPIANYFPAIVTEEEFIRVQQGRRTRIISGMGRKGDSYNNIFSKRAVCGLCGEPMHFINRGSAPKGGNYLFCSGTRRNQCDAKPWRYERFERAFLNQVKLLDLTSLFAGGDSEIEGLRHLIDAKEGELNKLDKQIRGALELLAGPNADSSYISKVVRELESKAVSVQQAKENLSKRCGELSAQADAASELDLLKLLKDIQEKSDDQYLKRAKIAQRIRVLIDQIRIFPQTDDRNVILNWANKRVQEIKLGAEAPQTSDTSIPMFDIRLPNGVENRFSINNLT